MREPSDDRMLTVFPETDNLPGIVADNIRYQFVIAVWSAEAAESAA